MLFASFIQVVLNSNSFINLIKLCSGNSTMNSPVRDNDWISSIPPVILNNPREKIEPEEIPTHDILSHEQHKPALKEEKSVIIFANDLPAPRYPLSIVWAPSALFFDINDTLNIQKIRIWNVCSRSIYIVCCGLWGETARIGAKWRCFPRTRFLLAPGLSADLFIYATPREQSAVPYAQIAIQLAAGHKRDTVVGYFVIPIVVKFHKYVQPCLGEAETSNNKISV